MGKRETHAPCAKCGKLYERDELERIPTGFGRMKIAGPRSPTGWSKVSERRTVQFLKTENQCFRCLGYKDGEEQPKSSPNHAAAAGFKRFGPNQ